MPNKDIESILKMEHLRFERIHFKSIGPENKLEPTFSFKFGQGIVDESEEKEERHIVFLEAHIEKEHVFDLLVKLVAEFTFDETDEIDDDFKSSLLQQNAVAILFPYLRSQISLMTAQPNLTPIVLPPLNIAALFEENRISEEKQSDSM